MSAAWLSLCRPKFMEGVWFKKTRKHYPLAKTVVSLEIQPVCVLSTYFRTALLLIPFLLLNFVECGRVLNFARSRMQSNNVRDLYDPSSPHLSEC